MPIKSGYLSFAAIRSRRAYTLVLILVLIAITMGVSAYLFRNSLGLVTKTQEAVETTRLQMVTNGLLEEAVSNIRSLMVAGLLPEIIVPGGTPGVPEGCTTSSVGGAISFGGNVVLENSFPILENSTLDLGARVTVSSRFTEKCLQEIATAPGDISLPGFPPALIARLAEAPLWVDRSNSLNGREKIRVNTPDFSAGSPNLGGKSRVYHVEVEASAAKKSSIIVAEVEVRPLRRNYGLLVGGVDLNVPSLTFFGPGTFGGRVHVNDTHGPKIMFSLLNGSLVFQEPFTSAVPIDFDCSDGSCDVTTGSYFLDFQKGRGICSRSGCSEYSVDVSQYARQLSDMLITPPARAHVIALDNDETIRVTTGASGSGCTVERYTGVAGSEWVAIESDLTHPEGIFVYRQKPAVGSGTLHLAESTVDCRLTILAENLQVEGSVRYRSHVDGRAPAAEMMGLFATNKFRIDPMKTFPDYFQGTAGAYELPSSEVQKFSILRIDGVVMAGEGPVLNGMENVPGLDGQANAQIFQPDGSLRTCNQDADRCPPGMAGTPNIYFTPFKEVGALEVYGGMYVLDKFKLLKIRTGMRGVVGANTDDFGVRGADFRYDPRVEFAPPPGMPNAGSQNLFEVVVRSKHFVKKM